MATVNTTPTAVLAPRGDAVRVTARAAPPQLLRCSVVSLCPDRRRLIRAAAEAQAWDAIICRDAGEFLRMAFKRSVPLVLIDLPAQLGDSYQELKGVAERVKEMSDSLLLISGMSAEAGEELWARCLGTWAYLSEANSQRGFEFVLEEARQVIDRRMAAIDFAVPGE